MGCRPANATTCALGLELSAGLSGVEHLADLDAAIYELGARRLDVGHDEIKTLGRAGCGGRDIRAELNRTPRAGRRELDHPEPIEGKVGVEPPTQVAVKALGTIDVRNRDDDDLELQVDRPRSRGAGHVELLRFGCLAMATYVQAPRPIAQLALFVLVPAIALGSMNQFMASTRFTLSWSRCGQNTVCMANLRSSYSNLQLLARLVGSLCISSENKRWS